uniref:Adenylate/guanylate cyclase domain-containing protein n=1 Tax=Desulfatirhabdium butyrativorans TaxID=340467 RepID=A0A7C4RPS7_9BACT
MKLTWNGRFILITTVIVIAIYFLSPPFLELVELKLWDLHFRQRGTVQPSGKIAFVGVDEDSVNEIGRWPWPRRKMAELIKAVEKAGAKGIGLDMGFFEPDPKLRQQAIIDLKYSLENLMAVSDHATVLAFLDSLVHEEDDDFLLAKALRSLSIPIVLGHFFYFDPKAFIPPVPPEAVLNQAAVRLVRQQETPAPGVLAEAVGMETNLAPFMESTPYSASFNVFADPDGTVRWMPLVIHYQNRLFPSLALQTLAASYPDRSLMVTVDRNGIAEIRFGRVAIPTNNRGEVLVNHYGPSYTFPYMSAVRLMTTPDASKPLKDRIVIIGNTTVGLHDMRPTPFDPVFPGVELHCAVMENILNESFLHRSDRNAMWMDLAAIVFMSLLFGCIARFTRGMGAFLTVVVSALGYVAFTHYAFLSLRIWVNHLYPLVNLFVVYIGTSVHGYMSEEREKRKIRETFGLYVQDSVVEKMLEHPELLRLGGEKKVLTVLFSDIRGFTTLSEGMTPEDLVSLLNEYLSAMTHIVLENHGTLDKYIGDAIMAIFGAPLDDPDHAIHACQTALRMNERLQELRTHWIETGKPALSIGIGINTGPMVVGNMGSARRFDYTVLGDNVNLASRLEGLTKMYGTTIIVSDATWQAIGGHFWGRMLDRVRVKGKHLPVGIYEVLAIKTPESTDRYGETIRLFEEGIRLYETKHWKDAVERFECVLRLLPEDPPSLLYIDRCRTLMECPPDDAWDGITTLDHK